MTLEKVTFEYSDGTSKYITGEEVDKWVNFNTLVASLAKNHGMNPPWEDVKWKTSPTKSEEDKNYSQYKEK